MGKVWRGREEGVEMRRAGRPVTEQRAGAGAQSQMLLEAPWEFLNLGASVSRLQMAVRIE